MTHPIYASLQFGERLIGSCDPLFDESVDDIHVGGVKNSAEDISERSWPNTIEGPVHRGFLVLAELYLEADHRQRQVLRDCAKGLDLSEFINRVAHLIESPKDTHWLRIALAVTGMDAGMSEYRDLICALDALKRQAKKKRIDIQSFFDEAKQASPDIAEWLDRDE